MNDDAPSPCDPGPPAVEGGTEVRGIGIADGVAVGPVVFLNQEPSQVTRRVIAASRVDAEVERFRRGVDEAETEFRRQASEFSAKFEGAEKRIFDAHVQFYQDEVLRSAIEERIRAQSINAEAAVDDEVDHLASVLRGMDGLFRERQADIRDVGRRIVRALLREQAAEVESGDEPFVLYARELLPSDTMQLDRDRLLAIVTEVGGDASHVAILARAFEIPAVSGIRKLQSQVCAGAVVAVDGAQGRIVVEPSAAQRTEFDERRRVFDEARQRRRERAGERSRAEVEFDVCVHLNIENYEALEPEVLASTDGIGLYRTEFLFMGRKTFPSEEEQYTFYRGVLDRAGDREITFRTIDVGGDKPLSYLSTPREQNPVLGWRGIRLTYQWPDLLIPQMRALLRASVHGRLKILLPMVTNVEEFRQVVELMQRLLSDLEGEGVSVPPPALGAMIEVPSAAMAAADLAAEADFLSVGTNDLGQYFFAADRNNLQVSHLCQPLHPAMLRLLGDVIRAADEAEVPVTVCGEMAGISASVLALYGLGLRRFSMSPSHLPEARVVFDAFTPQEAEALVSSLLRLTTESEVASMLRSALDDRLSAS